MQIGETGRGSLNGCTSLACSYETERTEGDRDRLAHNLEVESWPVRGVLAAFLLRTCCFNLSNREP
jgi:hypothetical protein